MHRSPRLILLLSVLAGVLLVTAITPVPQTRAAVVLDQAFVPAADRTEFIRAGNLDISPLILRESGAQSFTAGRSGPLVQVELLLRGVALNDPPLGPVVDITTAAGGLPTTTVLASTTIPPAQLAATYNWVSVAFALPPTVHEGQSYAIVLRPPAAAQSPYDVRWRTDNFGVYAGGGVARNTNNAGWFLSAVDAGFRTYVDSTPTLPIVTVTLPAPDGMNGWYRTSPVTAIVTATTVSPSTLATLTCTTGTLGMVSGLGTATATAQLSLTSQGTSTGTCSATSPNGDPGISAPFTIMLDSVAPTYTTSLTTADGQPYTPGTPATQPVTVTFVCSDATSGVGGVVASVTFTGVGLDQTAMLTCGDVAGNSTILSVGNIDIPKLAGGSGPTPTPTPGPSPSPKPGQPTPTPSPSPDPSASPSTSPTPTPSPAPKPTPAPPTQTPIPTAAPTMPPKPGQPTPTPAPACHSAQVCGGPTLR